MQPWNDWYHCSGNTYGTWLRGDPRGWRARHHREHVEGDYKNPAPANMYAMEHRHSQKLLVKPPVQLSPAHAELAGKAMVTRLLDAGVELLSLSIDDHHFHLVGRFRDHLPRKYVGLAKLRATAALKLEFGFEAPIWAKRSKCLPVTSRASGAQREL